ncbi:MAG TPA: glycosyltransferase family 4 protein [Candidatus Hydrogenedentes bacterium]|nr:glycosyltransferase family 4 protein [Candidatus Hydrogenedentota bacterium]HIJ74029.1 glycosyltransferase family 4 protein [Candidatus Hydrogenedentota bacterium]
MQVLFLTLYPDIVASPRYRVAQFLPYLRERGVECTVASALTERQYAQLTGPDRQGRPLWYHLAETSRRLAQIAGAAAYDIVFVQKALMTASVRGAFGLLRRRARRIVYDLDDAVHLSPPHPLRRLGRLIEARRQIPKAMRAADMVLAGNAWLAAQAEALGARAAYFPTVVDMRRFAPRPQVAEKYRIGWIGTPAATECIEPAAEALAGLANAEIHLVGADAKAVCWFGAVVEPWSLDGEVEAIQQFSAGIMPMPKQEWMKGKCGLKGLLYMACGIPCIATPFGAALEFIRHGENGMFADTTAEWRDAFERLRDPTERRRLGAAARTTVEENYALDKAAPRLLELMESVL